MCNVFLYYHFAVLNGTDTGARSDIVCLNTALILYLMKQSSTIKEGFYKAKDIIKSGKALHKLRDWVGEQNHDPQKGLTKLELLTQKALSLQCS